MTSLRVSLAVAAALALSVGGTAFAATQHSAHPAKAHKAHHMVRMARVVGTQSSAGCPNMGPSSASTASAAA